MGAKLRIELKDPLSSRHPHEHSHGSISDLPLPKAIDRKAVAGIADSLSDQEVSIIMYAWNRF